MSNNVINKKASRAVMDALIRDTAAPWMVPIYKAVRDDGVLYCLILPDAGPFEPPPPQGHGDPHRRRPRAGGALRGAGRLRQAEH